MNLNTSIRGRRSQRRSHSAAFTLIEMVLAISLSVGLAGTAIWFYQHTGEVRTAALEQMDQISSRRQLMDRVTMQLRGAIQLPLSNTGVQGTTDQLNFVTAALPGRAAWAVRQTTEDLIPAEQDLVLVSYGLRYVETDDGYTTIEGLESRAQKILNAPVVEEGEEIQSLLLSTQTRFVRFQYWDGAEWLTAWDPAEQEGLPKAVEVAIGTQPLPENTEPVDYEFDLIRRVIYLPGASGQSAEGSLLRGLSGSGLGGGL